MSEVKVDPGLLVAHATVKTDVPVEKVEEILLEEMDRIKNNPPTKAELEVARTQSHAWIGFANDGVTHRGMITAFFEMAGELFCMGYFGLGLDYPRKFPGITAGLTPNWIRRQLRSTSVWRAARLPWRDP